MPDLVCYTNDVPALIAEAVSLGLDNWVYDDDGEWKLAGDKTPLIGDGTEFLSLLRVEDTGLLSSMNNIEALGYYDGDAFVPVSSDAQATYSRLYSPSTLQVETAIAGTVEVPARPRIGAFYE